MALAAALPVAATAWPKLALAADPITGPEMVMGSADAPVEIIEYASLTCPHCQHFHEAILPGLKENFIDTGKVRFIYRDFPLDQAALRASMLARCGGERTYFSLLGVLFERQGAWTSAANPMKELAKIGRLAGIGNAQFDACMQNADLENAVLQSRLDGHNKFKVSSTPTIIINGDKYTGEHEYEPFAEAVNKLLDGS
ncbi:DsbA family protein [Oceanibacterium hippocampi]|uniref:DsbA family protein n=1 Tax=Oceanibacterium hippocampi TaxID=745714 RepID=UPI001594D61D|nr:DsbA family protein [Oceanibacterium hippocampi]